MRLSLLLAGLAGFAGGPAMADEDAPPPPAPAPNRVTAELAGGRAHLVAHFSLLVTGPELGPTVELELPSHGVVTGATASVGGKSHRLALLDKATAQSAFDALVAAAGGRDRAWAVQLSGHPATSVLAVSLAAPHRDRIALELEIEVGACFYRDARYVAIPQAWQAGLPPGLAAPKHIAGLAAACGSDDEASWIVLRTSELSAVPAGQPRIGTTAGRLEIGADHFARVEVDLGSKLSEVPGDLATAILIDGSRSVSEREAEVQRAIVAAYLRAVPNSRVQVIDYARTARALLPAWTAAPAAAARVDRAIRELVPRNGSNLDAGLVEAAAWLGRIQGTRRIIAFTDERLAARLQTMPAAALRDLIPSGTLVHVVALDEAGGTLSRDDADMFTSFVAPTEGIVVRGRMGSKPVDATILARPIILDSVEIRAPGWTDFHPGRDACEIERGTELAEGVACTWWGQGKSAAGPIEIKGLLWNTRFTRLLRPDPSQGRELARALSTTEVLEARLQAGVDRAAVALGRVWSLYATWGGSAGYGDVGLAGISLGSISACGCDDGGFGTIGHGSGSGAIRLQIDLRSQFAEAAKRCHAAPGTVKVSIETTREEIVAVGVDVAPFAPAIHDCLVEAVWDTNIAIPNAPAHSDTSFAL